MTITKVAADDGRIWEFDWKPTAGPCIRLTESQKRDVIRELIRTGAI